MIASPPQPRTAAPDAPSADPARAWLIRLPVADLPAFAPAPAISGGERTAAETAAAARAAACPDLFVVHAPDPATGEPVIAEVARLCAAADRVLILSPDPLAADRLVERLAKAHCGTVVRALADDENPARPLPLAAKATSAAILAARAELLPREAAGAVAAADARLTALERLIDLAEKTAKLDAEIARVTTLADAIEPQVRAETDTPFTRKLDALAAEYKTTAARLEAERHAATALRAEKIAALADLQHQHTATLAEGGKRPGFFARLFGAGKHGPDAAEIEKHRRETEAEIAAIDAHSAELQAKTDGLAPELQIDREKATQAEVAERRAEFDAKLAALAADRDRLRSETETLGPAVAANPLSPDELVALRYEATRELLAVRERAAEVNRDARELARRFLAESRVVVGTPGSLQADPVFAPRDNRAGPAFDLLVLDRAEELGEHDFVNLAKLAARWVLVGDATPLPAEEPRAHLNGAHSRQPARNGRPPQGSFAGRLARALDRETWIHEGDRLVCRLAFPLADRRHAMTREPLLDRPEIELRFLADADGEPVLAEVAFPGGTATAAARSFLFHQLGEVLLRPCGPVHWHHAAAAITASWPAADHGSDATWIDLEPGVREKIVGAGIAAFTAAVSFDPAAGWDADRAAAWLAAHFPAPSAGRFAAVPAASPTARRHVSAS